MADPGRRRRAMLRWMVVVVAIIVGLAAWSVTHRDTYATGDADCVTVMVASSTGGAAVHECGDRARALCASAAAGADTLSALIREHCALSSRNRSEKPPAARASLVRGRQG